MEKKIDIIEEAARKRARKFYYSSPHIKTVRLVNKTTKEPIKCQECGNLNFKFYKKIGGIILSSVTGYKNKVIKNNPYKHNYICKCGIRLILTEDEFGFAKIKYGCSAGKCPFGKSRMEKDCLSCKYIYEK